MNKFVRTTAVGAGLIWVALGSTGLAAAAATAPVNAATVDVAKTVHDLTANGYRVILDKVGNEPLSLCHVTSIRPGQPVTETVPAGGGDTEQKVLYTPVYVNVGC
jgi:hypothetical protein